MSRKRNEFVFRKDRGRKERRKEERKEGRKKGRKEGGNK